MQNVAVLQQIWLYKIIGGTLPMCQNTTTRVNGAWIKRYCVLCSKTYNPLHRCHNFPAGSRQATRGARICETSLYWPLSSTWPEFDPDTAYVVCISVSLGFRQKPSDTALFSVTALTTFKCIVRVSVTKGALVCFVVIDHWWRHRTNYDVTEAYRALRNDCNRSFEQWVSTRGPERNPQTLRNDDESKRQSTIYTGDFGAIFTTYGINPYS